MSDIGRSQFRTSLLVFGWAYKGDNAMALGLILVIVLVISASAASDPKVAPDADPPWPRARRYWR